MAKPLVININRIPNYFQDRLCETTSKSILSEWCSWAEWLKLRKIICLALLLGRNCGSHSCTFYVLLSHISSFYCSCVHVQIIHILFWNIFIFRSAIVWSWWISLPRSCDLCLPELAVWWGPRLPWWFRRVFRYLWVERFSCYSGLPYMWISMSVVFMDDWCCNWFSLFFQLA